MSQELIVDIKGLSKYYGENKAVDNIDLQIPRGTIFGFLGPNGAGKSTTINTLITLLRPTSGSGVIAGYDLYDTKGIKQVVGAVFQEQTLDEMLTARQNLVLNGELYNLNKEVLQKKIESLTKMVGLTDRLDEVVQNYSGGMRRRLEIVRGLLADPQILFLDEPTIGLDPQSRANLREKIHLLNKENNLTIFLTTHDMEEAEELCDQICIIDKGRIVVRGTPSELKDSVGSDIVLLDMVDNDEAICHVIEGVEGVLEVKYTGNKFQASVEDGSKTLVKIIQRLNEEKLEINSVEIRKPTLNEVFLYYTGKELRDQEIDLADRLKIVGRKGRRRMGMMRR